jgi:hypothetical protein
MSLQIQTYGHAKGGIQCLWGVSYPYKHRPLDILEMGSGVWEEYVSLQTQIRRHTRGGIRCLVGVSIPKNTDPWIYYRWDSVSDIRISTYRGGVGFFSLLFGLSRKKNLWWNFFDWWCGSPWKKSWICNRILQLSMRQNVSGWGGQWKRARDKEIFRCFFFCATQSFSYFGKECNHDIL